MSPQTTIKKQYRIESKSPQDRRFRYRAISRSLSGDLVKIHQWMEEHQRAYPDWKFRIASRVRSVTETDWEVGE